MTSELRKKYGSLVDHFTFYASYHANPVNQWIHITCVPMILFTAFAMISRAQISSYLPVDIVKAISTYTGFTPDASMVIALGYFLYYSYLSFSPVGFSASAIVFLIWFAAEKWVAAVGANFWNPAIIIHVVAWVAQFYGHGVHEGRSPALLDNLFQALFMAPFFVWLETLIKLGFLQDFHKAINPIVMKSVEEFRLSKARKTK